MSLFSARIRKKVFFYLRQPDLDLKMDRQLFRVVRLLLWVVYIFMKYCQRGTCVALRCVDLHCVVRVFMCVSMHEWVHMCEQVRT